MYDGDFSKLVHPCYGICWAIKTLHKCVALLTMTWYYLLSPFYPWCVGPLNGSFQLWANCCVWQTWTIYDGDFSKLVHPCHDVCWAITTLHKCAALLAMTYYLLLPFYPLKAPKWIVSSPRQLCVAKLNYLCMKDTFQSLSIHAMMYVEPLKHFISVQPSSPWHTTCYYHSNPCVGPLNGSFQL